MGKEVITKDVSLCLHELMLDSGIGSEEEAFYVSGVLLKHVKTCRAHADHVIDDPRAMIIPQLHKRMQGEDDITFAEKAFVSVGVFRDRMEWLTKFRGLPKYQVYGDTSRGILFHSGKEEVSEHFYDWADFLYESFKQEERNPEGIKIPGVYTKTRYHQSFGELGTNNIKGKLKRGYDLLFPEEECDFDGLIDKLLDE